MSLTRLTLLFAFSTATVAACSVEPVTGRPGAAEQDESERGLGKADGVFGSCEVGNKDFCGGPAPAGNCWCDELCVDFGDCCADKVDVCGGEGNEDPTPKLCLGDNACDDGEVCDHTECLSGCPAGGICPAVCYGECVPGEGDDDDDDDDAGDDDDDAECWTLDEEACDEDDECQWTTVPGFPGPISMCEPVDGDDEDDDDDHDDDDDDATADCEFGDEYLAVSGEELAADPMSFVGQQIVVTGDALVGFPICTQLACSIENPCCNACGAGINMDLGTMELELNGVGCGGNNCEVTNNCDYPDGETFTAWGTLDELFGLVRLDVDGHCAS